jgi:hypothetical protein
VLLVLLVEILHRGNDVRRRKIAQRAE